MRLSCLARNGRSPGEESLTAAIAVQAIEAQPAFGQIKPMRGQVLACAEQHLGDVPANHRLKQEAPHFRRRKRKPGVQKGGPLSPNRQKPAYPPATAGAVCRRHHLAQSKHETGARCRDQQTKPCCQRHANQEITDAHGHRSVVAAPFGGRTGPSAAPGLRAGSVCIDTFAQAMPPTAMAPIAANDSRHHSEGMPRCARERVTL